MLYYSHEKILIQYDFDNIFNVLTKLKSFIKIKLFIMYNIYVQG